jgi:uncharacterized protein YcaQ
MPSPSPGGARPRPLAARMPSGLPALSISRARRLALAAQGLARPAPPRTTARTLRTTLSQLGAIQIDSINVVARAHELTLAARLDQPDPARFDQVVYRDRAGFEYWGHAASFLPMESYRLFLPKMRRIADRAGGWFPETREAHAPLYPVILDRLAAEGPLPASAFREPGGGRRGPWWDWTPAKRVLEDLFASGRIMAADRVRFERRYDLTEKVLPPGLDLSVPTREEATLELIVLAVRALGIGTFADVIDYFRLRVDAARPAMAEAIASGLVEEVAVQGWTDTGYVIPGAAVPRAITRPPVLLTPFDSLIWFRERSERVFDFAYRLEVYVPAAKRRYGYYTMPVLAGDRLIGRVDPKLDRKTRRLLLRAIHLEDGVDRDEGLAATASAAWRLAGQLGADEVVAEPAGDAALELALAAGPQPSTAGADPPAAAP